MFRQLDADEFAMPRKCVHLKCLQQSIHNNFIASINHSLKRHKRTKFCSTTIVHHLNPQMQLFHHSALRTQIMAPLLNQLAPQEMLEDTITAKESKMCPWRWPKQNRRQALLLRHPCLRQRTIPRLHQLLCWPISKQKHWAMIDFLCFNIMKCFQYLPQHYAYSIVNLRK